MNARTMTTPKYRWLKRSLLALLVLGLLLVAYIGWRNYGIAPKVDDTAPRPVATAEQIERGRYLAVLGNCAGCHTARGGADYAGGVAVETPFGDVFAGNLTADPDTGLGRWNADHFWRALHHGQSRDGRLLYPAFPYPSYSKMSRDDSDALFAYLQSLPPVRAENKPHTLRAPYDSVAALAFWRAFFFSPGEYQPDPRQDAQWNRGAWLAQGPGHCGACHSPRNAFGATTTEHGMSGSLMPNNDWYAPSLVATDEASFSPWTVEEGVALLRDGINAHATVTGPMADVVYTSLQHWREDDLTALVHYLRSLPEPPAAARATPRQDEPLQRLGQGLYAEHCARCHGDAGQGVPGIYPPLAGNRAVLMRSPINLVRIVRNGGYPPSTAGNPRPYGMPPFVHVLSENEIAAVLTYIRSSWGNQAQPVSRAQVQQF